MRLKEQYKSVCEALIGLRIVINHEREFSDLVCSGCGTVGRCVYDIYEIRMGTYAYYPLFVLLHERFKRGGILFISMLKEGEMKVTESLIVRALYKIYGRSMPT